MKKHVFYLIVLFLTVSHAQSLRLGFSYGIHKTNDISFSLDKTNYSVGLESDKHYGIKLKLGLPAINLSAYMNKFNNESNETINGIRNRVEYNYWVMGIGAEMTVIPGPVNVYLAGDFLMTTSGETKIVNAFNNFTESRDTKFGIGIGAGVDIKILPMFDLDVTAKYNMNNLINKESGEKNLNTFSITATVLFSLL